MHDLKSEIQVVTQAKHNLHIPTLMPDEFFLGYLGRITLINGLDSTSSTNKILSAWIKQSHPTTRAVPSAFSLAKVSGLDLETFIRQHTLVPIVSAIKTGKFLSNGYADANQNIDLQGMLVLTSKKIKKVACFCESCVKEDQGYLGFSFWRRSHQLSGVDSCTKHNIPLYEVNGKEAYATQPSKHFMNKNFSKTSIDQSTLNPVTLRYVQLIQDALDLKTPLDFKSTRQVLLNQSKKFSIRTTVQGNKRTLSDLIIEQLPKDWAIKHFPNLIKKQPGAYLSSFDDILRPNSNGKSCMNTLLAAAVLFENADEAIYELTQHQYQPPPAFKPSISDETILKTYIKHQGNIRQIASVLNRDYGFMRNKTAKIGLPALTNLDQVTVNAIKAFYDGEDLLGLINKPGINLEMFAKIIRTAGMRFSSTMKKFKDNVS